MSRRDWNGDAQGERILLPEPDASELSALAERTLDDMHRLSRMAGFARVDLAALRNRANGIYVQADRLRRLVDSLCSRYGK